MPLTYNGNSPIRIKYNGNEVRKVKWTAWEGGKGKNLFKLPDSGTLNDITYTKNADGTFNLTGVAGSVTTFYINVDTTLPSGNYVLSRNFNNPNVRFILQDFNGTSWISTMVTFSTGTSSQVSLNPVGNATRFMVQVLSGASVNITNGEIQLEKGTTATPFAPYENIPTVWRLLPEEYTEVEWLQSDGACYIDLNRTPNMNDIIEQKFMTLNTTNTVCSWYGSMPANNIVKPRFSMGISSNGFFVGANNTIGYTSLDNDIHVIRWQQITGSTLTTDLDGTEATRPASGGYDPAVELTSYLFARHGNNGVQIYDGDGTRIYYHKEYLSNGTIQLDLVPVIRNSDNEPGIYDLVNKVFYTNAGSGTFTAGPIANFPSGYTQLEYLESSGTQIIDLGLKWTYNTSTKTVCEMLGSESLALGCVGVRNSTSAVWGNYMNKTGTNYACFGDRVNVTFVQDMVDGNFHEWETNNTGFYLDGVKKTNLSGSTESLVSINNIGLFARYDAVSGGIDRLGKWKIKSHQTYNNNVLIQDLIPARRNSDNELGMYDLVSETFFTNAGTGTFTAGPAIG